MASLSSLNFLLILFTTTAFALAAGKTFQVDFHHRFSDKVHEWAELQGLHTTWQPEEAPKGSVEYYKELVRHDEALLSRHGRLLKNTDIYTFAMGNETTFIRSLGYLHYALASVGTPNQTFMVALSTGSDIFWLPCNCKQCAPLSSPLYGDVKFSTYSTKASSTGKEISCDSSECKLLSSAGDTCKGINNCPYSINYTSEDTSSGFLVRDVLYLAKGNTGADIVQVPIVFGCGEVQTGFFLDTGAPNGVMGLGIANVSVPTMLAQKGLISDSFSMCFGADGSGRLNFGDKGSSDQSETPLVIDNNSASYTISIEGMVIGNTTSKTSFTAEVDSGSSFTYLTDQIYKEFTTMFTEQVTESPLSDSTLPFDYCYEWGVGQTEVYLPVVNFTTQDGSTFPVLDPIIRVYSNTSQDSVGYCLGVLPGTGINIIGQNFLIGQRIIFDREKKVLGWQEFDCYSAKSSTTLPTNQNSTTDLPTNKNATASASPTVSPAAEAPPPLNPGTTQLHRKSWAPNLCPPTMLNTALSLLFMVFVIFNSIQ